MKQVMRHWNVVIVVVLLLSLVLATLAPSVQAAPLLATASFTGSYTQNFNTLQTGGGPAWEDDKTIPSWYSNRVAYYPNYGNLLTGGLHSYGSVGPTERALGSLGFPISATTIQYGVVLRNDTGSPITSLTVAYTGEQWRSSGVAAVQSLTFAYKTLSAVPLFTDPSYVNVAALNFNSPIVGGSISHLDGNIAANRTFVSSTITGLNWLSGEYIMLRWTDIDDSDVADHGLAIDDLSVTQPPPTAINLSAFSAQPTAGLPVLPFVLGGVVLLGAVSVLRKRQS